MLDAVPRTEPGVSFTQTTMEMVVGEATKSVGGRSRPWVWPLRIAVLMIIPAVLFASGYALTRSFQTGTDRLLVQDLSIIANYPKYLVVENSVEFLETLVDRNLFSDGSVFDHNENAIVVEIHDAEDAGNIPDDLEGRKALIAGMDLDEKAELKKKLDDYLKLSEQEVDQFHQFDQRLHEHEQKSQLLNVMNSYYDWLKTLNSSERARLLDLAGNERIKEISRLRDLQAREAFGKTEFPTTDDRDLVFRWSEGSFWLKETQIRNRFPIALARIAEEKKLRPPPAQLTRRLSKNGSLPGLVSYLLRFDREFVGDLLLGDRDMNMLYRALSTDARQMLDDRTEPQQRELVLRWIELANQSKSDVSWSTLRRFEKTLSLKERDELDKMSTERYREALKAKYRAKQKSRLTRPRDDLESWRTYFNFEDIPQNAPLPRP